MNFIGKLLNSSYAREQFNVIAFLGATIEIDPLYAFIFERKYLDAISFLILLDEAIGADVKIQKYMEYNPHLKSHPILTDLFRTFEKL